MKALGYCVFGLILAGCAPSDTDDASETVNGKLTPLSVSQERVEAADGRQLLDVKSLPSNIAADADNEFGASGSITEASMSPDERWLAVATVGAAHGGGWLVSLDGNQTAHPAAFQYGGNVGIGPWSEDGRFAVFIMKGPAPSRTLSIVDSTNLGDTVAETSIPIRTDEHAEKAPGQYPYSTVEWDNGELVFEAGGQRYRVDPLSGEINQDE